MLKKEKKILDEYKLNYICESVATPLKLNVVRWPHHCANICICAGDLEYVHTHTIFTELLNI